MATHAFRASSNALSNVLPKAAAGSFSGSQTNEQERQSVSRYVAVAGRVLFSAIFIAAAPMHFSQVDIAYAKAAGVPASFLVPASGLLALVGALSVLLGYRANRCLALVFFLVPVTLSMHNFWAVQDPTMAQIQMAEEHFHLGRRADGFAVWSRAAEFGCPASFRSATLFLSPAPRLRREEDSFRASGGFPFW